MPSDTRVWSASSTTGSPKTVQSSWSSSFSKGRRSTIGEFGSAFYWPPTLGAAIGGVYGGFVELDDSIGDDASAKKKAPSGDTGPVKKKK